MFKALFTLFCLARPLAAGPVIVFLGDSLTAGYGLSEAQAYPALVQAGLKGWQVVNAGVSGDTSAGALKRLDWILKSSPQAVFVALGANDGLRGVAPEETYRNLKAVIRKAKASGAQVFLAGMRLPTNYGQDYNRRFAAVFPKIASEMKVELLPFLLEGVGGVSALNQGDGVHPNAQGQALIASRVQAFLAGRLKPLPPPSGGSKSAASSKVIRSRKDMKGK